MVSHIKGAPAIGRQLFDVITSGMYDNPLMVLREYVQNSVDSIDTAIEAGLLTLSEAEIVIKLSGGDRMITIQDNGVGLPNRDAATILRSLGCSPKEGTPKRGFRGIGRLGGLAYCDEVLFETRSCGDDEVAVISWDRLAFDKIAGENSTLVSLTETVHTVSKSTLRPPSEDEPKHFFRVTLRNVRRFHSDILMNLKVVSDYLAQVAPVMYCNDSFSYGQSIQEYLSKASEYWCYKVIVNGREVKRPYTDEVAISTNVKDTIAGIEYFTFTGAGNEEIIAIGWYAKSGFIASLPPQLNVRGLRIRQGNIEIGDEHFLDGMFSERRFASWQIGEIHILNNSLKPNARRDGFEHTKNFERFLEQASLLGRHLSSLCRKSSNERIARIRAEATFQKLEPLFAPATMYLDEEHYETAMKQARAAITQVEKATSTVNDEMQKKFLALKAVVEGNSYKPVYLRDVLDGRRLRGYDPKSLLKHIAKAVIEAYGRCSSAEDILQIIFADFAKQGRTIGPPVLPADPGKHLS